MRPCATAPMLDRMQTRAQLHDVLDHAGFDALDTIINASQLPKGS